MKDTQEILDRLVKVCFRITNETPADTPLKTMLRDVVYELEDSDRHYGDLLRRCQDKIDNRFNHQHRKA